MRPDAAGRYLAHARGLLADAIAHAPDGAATALRAAARAGGGDELDELLRAGERHALPRAFWLSLRQACVCLGRTPDADAIDTRLRDGA